MLATFTSILSKNSRRAVAYYRHSAEDKQENSIPIQRELTHKFASIHQIEILHEEADEGETGLLADRPGFNALFENWILNDHAPHIDYILLTHVDRWGRFQDPDEAAYYEFRCKKRGKQVIYISRGFPNEEQKLMTHLQTSIERYMAAEYSRQLSERVFQGCVKVSQQGLSAGGTPCYGMARLLLNAQKKPYRVLQQGEHKQIDNEHVTFIPANDNTTKTVRNIFIFFVRDNLAPQQIARLLNQQKIPSARGGQWDSAKILRVLRNETYSGTRIYNKTWNRLRSGKRRNPKNDWIVCHNAFPALIEAELFDRAQKNLQQSLGDRLSKSHTIRVEKFLMTQVQRHILGHGFLNEHVHNICRNLPLLFSTRMSKAEISQWCFVLPQKMRRYEFVLGVSITTNRHNPADVLFSIPTQDFGICGTRMFSDRETAFKQYSLPPEKFSQTVLSLAERLLGKSRDIRCHTP